MNDKIKKILIPFILMFVFNIIFVDLDILIDFGVFVPHVGILYVSGLLFGPYGAFGAVAANIILDFYSGYTPIEIIPSAIFSFGVSYLAYKMWYSGFNKKREINQPILDNIYHISLFLVSILICGFIYSIVHGSLIYLFTTGMEYTEFMTMEYFLNFINVAFIFGIISIWLSKKISFVHIPKKSKRAVNHKLYNIILVLLILSLINLIIMLYLELETSLLIGIVVVGILLSIYLTKPFEKDVTLIKHTSITEKVTTIFLFTTLLISFSGILLSILMSDSSNLINMDLLNYYLPAMPLLIVTDAIILLFFIPGFFIIHYIENRVIGPISSFSQIENFIHENEKIEAEKLIEVYSDYIKEDDEIGMLARSYTDLINHNNNYIENIREIEGEKERIKAELDIATRIQASKLPTESIENDDYVVNGYSHPAKEVGGDFFDYYQLDDDNLAIVIGDASGKGVPAALLATVTQSMIKQILKHDLDPSHVLSLLNNQLCENNSESMFITSWLGIYNKTTCKLTFSNAGHNPPLIKENGEFRYLDIDSGIVLGIMEDFEYVKEEITLSDALVLYTDGITDANNKENEMYGENRLLNFFNKFKLNKNPLTPLLEDITKFTEGSEQFDDMTLLYLKIKDD